MYIYVLAQLNLFALGYLDICCQQTKGIGGHTQPSKIFDPCISKQ